MCLLDIHLPDGSGLDLARLLKARNKARLIAVTAGGFQKDADAIAAAGFDAYLLKPYKIAEMRAGLDGDRGRLAQ